jgi:hypothetical protein
VVKCAKNELKSHPRKTNMQAYYCHFLVDFKACPAVCKNSLLFPLFINNSFQCLN